MVSITKSLFPSFFVHICLKNSGKSGAGRVDGAKELGKQLVAGRQFTDGADVVLSLIHISPFSRGVLPGSTTM